MTLKWWLFDCLCDLPGIAILLILLWLVRREYRKKERSINFQFSLLDTVALSIGVGIVPSVFPFLFADARFIIFFFIPGGSLGALLGKACQLAYSDPGKTRENFAFMLCGVAGSIALLFIGWFITYMSLYRP